jgi:hypothetical protein
VALPQPQPPDDPRRLTVTQRRQLRFVLEVVDGLAERDGFDPAELRSLRTGEPLGPVIERMRAALDFDELGDEADSTTD